MPLLLGVHSVSLLLTLFLFAATLFLSLGAQSQPCPDLGVIHHLRWV